MLIHFFFGSSLYYVHKLATMSLDIDADVPGSPAGRAIELELVSRAHP